jgi:hypothetical protein
MPTVFRQLNARKGQEVEQRALAGTRTSVSRRSTLAMAAIAVLWAALPVIMAVGI